MGCINVKPSALVQTSPSPENLRIRQCNRPILHFQSSTSWVYNIHWCNGASCMLFHPLGLPPKEHHPSTPGPSRLALLGGGAMLQLWLLSSKLQAMCPKVPCIDYLAHTVTSNMSMEVYGGVSSAFGYWCFGHPCPEQCYTHNRWNCLV